MSNMQEIRSKIVAIQNIKKISKAMEMIASSKMRKTQKRMLNSRPYSEMIRKVISHVTLGHLEYKHPYLINREVRKVGYLIVSTDRGLTGSLNNNLFKKVLFDIKYYNNVGVDVSLVLIGSKALSFFQFMKTKIVSQVTGMGDNPKLSDLIGPINSIIQLYDTFCIDKIYIIFNKFINVLRQVPEVLQLLPLIPFAEESKLKNKVWDYLYEPDSKILLNILLKRYIELQVYQGVVENLASEQAARMVAMKSASDNAESLINELHLIYNKVRQTKITQELVEIISGTI